ncbi:MAG: hypothetical protein AAGA48_05020 [Myxococcota bacterium]
MVSRAANRIAVLHHMDRWQRQSLDEWYLHLQLGPADAAGWNPKRICGFWIEWHALAEALGERGVVDVYTGFVHPALRGAIAGLLGWSRDQLYDVLNGRQVLRPDGTLGPALPGTPDRVVGARVVRAMLAEVEVDATWRRALDHFGLQNIESLVFHQLVGPPPAFRAPRYLHDGSRTMRRPSPVQHPLAHAFDELRSHVDRYRKLVELHAPPPILDAELREQTRPLETYFAVARKTAREGLEPRTGWVVPLRPSYEPVPIEPHPEEPPPVDEPASAIFIDPEHLLVQRASRVERLHVATGEVTPTSIPDTGFRLVGADDRQHLLFARGGLRVWDQRGDRWLDVVPSEMPAVIVQDADPEEAPFRNVRGGVVQRIEDLVEAGDRPTLLALSNDLRFALLGAAHQPTGIFAIETGFVHQHLTEPDWLVQPWTNTENPEAWKRGWTAHPLRHVPVALTDGTVQPAREWAWTDEHAKLGMPRPERRSALCSSNHGFRLLLPSGLWIDVMEDRVIPRALFIRDWEAAAFSSDGTRLALVDAAHFAVWDLRTLALVQTGSLAPAPFRDVRLVQ